MDVVHAITDIGRSLLRTILLCALVVVGAIAVMVGLATQSVAVAAAIVAPVVAFAALQLTPRGGRWLSAAQERRLRRRVGDPLALHGDWRRLLTGAWAARAEFRAAVARDAGTPVGERLAAQQVVVDAALERCGELARSGQRLHAQLKAFRPRRLQRDLLIERRRDRHGARATALARQLDDVDRLRSEVDRARVQLEKQVHDLRTAAWRAATLRSGVADEPDAALTELLDDLSHLKAALAEVERPQRQATAAF